MFEWIKSKFRKKSIDARALLGVDWGGSYADAFRRVPNPNKSALLEEYKSWAYVCANYNARVVYSTEVPMEHQPS
jgi:hypothetical protein